MCVYGVGYVEALEFVAYWRHSVIMWLTESPVPQELHIGFSSFAMRYLCKTDVANAESVDKYLLPSVLREFRPAEDSVFNLKIIV